MTPRHSGSRLTRLALAPRLLLNNLLVIVAGAGTVLLTAFAMAPSVFELHLQAAGVTIDASILGHIMMALQDAVLVPLGVGIVVATIAAATIGWLVARRLAAPVWEAADTSRRLANGQLDARVPDPGMGPEFATLAASVNELASRLQTTEATRRELTADLAHQLRTPIASIEATIEAIRDHVLPADDQTWETLAAQAARLRRLVADLEVVSRAEERQLLVNVEPVAIQRLVDAAVAAHREAYRAAGVQLHGSVADDTSSVVVDPQRIQEALDSLLDNALRHTATGGSVTVTGRRSGRPNDPVAIITVTDTGAGFTPTDSDRIFRRFAKGPDSPGSGLGLTIARAIVEAHHGTLTATSQGPGTGAQFTIALPTRSPGSSRASTS